MTKTTDQLLEDLAMKGGAIVATGNCSSLEIAVARRCGDMAVRDDGIGFIRRSPGWVKMADEGLAARAYDAAMHPRRSRSNTTVTDAEPSTPANTRAQSPRSV